MQQVRKGNHIQKSSGYGACTSRKIKPLRNDLLVPQKLKYKKQYSQKQSAPQQLGGGCALIFLDVFFSEMHGYTSQNDKYGTHIKSRRHLKILEPIRP